MDVFDELFGKEMLDDIEMVFRESKEIWMF